jgi:polyisoprenoid-binding protein YceI
MKVLSLTLSMAAIALAANFASAEALNLDTQSSLLTWKGGKKVVDTTHNGEIRLKSGSLELEKGKGKNAKPTVKGGKFEIDMATLTDLDLASNKEYQDKLVNHLKSEDFFDVAKFPTSEFVIEKVTPVKGDEYTVSGKLTIKGNTQPLSFPATITFDKGAAKADGTLKFDRTVWGLKYGSDKFFTGLGDKVIKDEIEIGLKLQTAAAEVKKEEKKAEKPAGKKSAKNDQK